MLAGSRVDQPNGCQRRGPQADRRNPSTDVDEHVGRLQRIDAQRARLPRRTTAELATIDSALALTIEAVGSEVPHGNTVRNVSAHGSTAVTETTAAVASGGTPLTPAIGTLSMWPAPSLPGRSRVSTARIGAGRSQRPPSAEAGVVTAAVAPRCPTTLPLCTESAPQAPDRERRRSGHPSRPPPADRGGCHPPRTNSTASLRSDAQSARISSGSRRLRSTSLL